MGNKRAGEFMLRQAEEADWERARTEPRPLSRQAHARGIGARRLQLVVSPSFEEAICWEIHNGPAGWVLYRPQVLQTWPDEWVVGCDPVPFAPTTLEAFFRRITSLTMPISPDLSGCGGCDGTRYQLACFGDLFSQWRFQWWSEHPPQWQPLVDIANEMIATFTAAG